MGWEKRTLERECDDCGNEDTSSGWYEEESDTWVCTPCYRPVYKLEDGNVFVVIGAVRQALRSAGKKKEADEFVERAMASGSYEAVLVMVHDYVEVV